MKSLKTEHCRLLNDAKEQTMKAAKYVSAVGVVNGIGAIFSAVGSGEDIHDWEANLSSTLVEAVKRLHEAESEIDKAIEIVMESGGADDENRS